MKEKASAARSKPERRVLLLVIAAFLLSGGVLGSISYLKTRAKAGNYAQREQAVPDMAPELQDARLAKVKVLRDKWKPWALQHKAGLQQMLHGDRSARDLVWQAIPVSTIEINPSSGRPGDITGDDISKGLHTFTWQPVLKTNFTTPDPTKPKLSLEGQNSETRSHTQQMLNDDFAQFPDIRLSQSRNSGAKTLSLWASGRIVEIETIHNPDKRSGQPSFKEEYREIAPPYEFLSEKGDTIP